MFLKITSSLLLRIYSLLLPTFLLSESLDIHELFQNLEETSLWRGPFHCPFWIFLILNWNLPLTAYNKLFLIQPTQHVSNLYSLWNIFILIHVKKAIWPFFKPSLFRIDNRFNHCSNNIDPRSFNSLIILESKHSSLYSSLKNSENFIVK